MRSKQTLLTITIILALGLLTSCNALDSIHPAEAAEAYLRENPKIPSFDTQFKEIASNDSIRAQVIVWANVKLREAREPEECETIVTVEKRGDSWKGKSATPFRPTNRPPTSSLTDIEVVEMGDRPGSFSLCKGNNVNPGALPTVRGKFQLCFRFSARETETLMVKFLKDEEEGEEVKETDWFVLEKSNSGWSSRFELSEGSYKVEFHQYGKVVATYKFYQKPAASVR